MSVAERFHSRGNKTAANGLGVGLCDMHEHLIERKGNKDRTW